MSQQYHHHCPPAHPCRQVRTLIQAYISYFGLAVFLYWMCSKTIKTQELASFDQTHLLESILDAILIKTALSEFDIQGKQLWNT